jgi:hypothetical protein
MIATIESQFNKSPVHFNTSPTILLDPERKSVRVEEFEQKLSELIIGQERAVQKRTAQSCVDHGRLRSAGRNKWPGSAVGSRIVSTRGHETKCQNC